MQEYISPPWMTVPLERAKRFRQGATKHFVDGAYMLSRALVWYWTHFQIESIRLGIRATTPFRGWVGLQPQKESVPCDLRGDGCVEGETTESSHTGSCGV